MQEDKLKQKYPLALGAENEFLRTVSSPVVRVDSDVVRFAKDLLELMRAYDGVGLAAPQVGKNVRIFAFSQRDYSKEKPKFLVEGVMINPEVVAVSQELIIDDEACLSLPGQKGDVARPDRVTMKYLDLKGHKKILKAVGYNARILLHELDHLNGVLFIDKLVKGKS